MPWISGLVFAAGVIAFLVAYVGNTGTSLQTKQSNAPAQRVKIPKTVPLERQTKYVAGKFILTAVARKDLATAWKLSGPGIRQDLTLKQWMSGDIPVVPFPVRDVDIAPMQVIYSYRRQALLRVALLPKHAKGQLFFIGLIKVGQGKHAHWVVNSWAPWSSTEVPDTLNN